MALTAVEIIALVFAVLALVKIIVIIFNKDWWYEKVVKNVYTGNEKISVVLLILGLVVFYYLVRAMSIVEIFAVMAFTGILIGIGFFTYSKEVLSLAKKVYAKKLSGWMWVYIVIWVALSVWVLYSVLI
jgi:hypothetical protein